MPIVALTSANTSATPSVVSATSHQALPIDSMRMPGTNSVTSQIARAVNTTRSRKRMG